MKPISLIAIGLAGWTLAAAGANADTIYDVEHARAAARAGLVTEEDVQYLRRWGGTSGYYPRLRYQEPLFVWRIPRVYDRRARRW